MERLDNWTYFWESEKSDRLFIMVSKIEQLLIYNYTLENTNYYINKNANNWVIKPNKFAYVFLILLLKFCFDS